MANAKVLGFSDRVQDIRDGTLCLQKSPRPGPTCHDSTVSLASPSLGLSGRFRSIREMTDALQLSIDGIQDSIKDLDKGTLPDSNDLAEFSSRFEALNSDIDAFRQKLHDLEVETGGRPPSPPVIAPLTTSSGELQKAFEKLLINAEKDGMLDSSSLQTLRDASDRAVRQQADAVDANPSTESMRKLVSELGVAIQLGLGAGDATEKAWALLTKRATDLTRWAEVYFRQNPTVDNFRDYSQKAANSMAVGGEGISLNPANLERKRPEREYQVKPGDTLPAISTLFYGKPCYWDLIYIENRKAIGEDPERLIPGMRLEIP